MGNFTVRVTTGNSSLVTPLTPKDEVSIFLVLVICLAFGQGKPRPEPINGTGPSLGTITSHGSGVSGTSNVNTGGSLADSTKKPECKWFVNRWGRPTSQNCKPTCTCSSRG